MDVKRTKGKIYVEDPKTGKIIEEYEDAERYLKLQDGHVVVHRPDTDVTTSIDIDKYNVIYWDEKGRKRVIKKRKNGIITDYEVNEGGCHITKVVVYGMGLPDDCYELTQLRRFRNEYLEKNGYSKEVEDYYRDAPYLADCIEKVARSDPDLYRKLYNNYIKPAVLEISKNNMSKAHEILREYLKFVREELCENICD